MTQNFDFEVNIEKRMPTTGNVFFVNRMTSDYAKAHPFDVDGFIEEVYQKWQDCETLTFRETREALHNQWIKTISVTNPRGDASIYPNNSAPHPALMEVWMKAGDYWRRGFRLGEVLPSIVPPTRITRLGDGEWICLFDHEMSLLKAQPEREAITQEPETPVVEAEEPAPAVETPTLSAPEPAPLRPTRRRKKTSTSKAAEPDLFAAEPEPKDHSNRNSKIFAAVATVALFVVIVNTIGLFGVAAVGLLAGGIFK